MTGRNRIEIESTGKIKLLVFSFYLLVFSSFNISAQSIELTLNQTIEIATAGSLQAFKAKNLYLSSYWEFRSFKASRLPTISFQFSPMQYTNSITQRYDYGENIPEFAYASPKTSSTLVDLDI